MKKTTKKALPKWATTVTPLSKLIALILFTALPFIGFYFGMQYQKDFPSEKSFNKYEFPAK